jgi:hypothetical protein
MAQTITSCFDNARNREAIMNSLFLPRNAIYILSIAVALTGCTMLGNSDSSPANLFPIKAGEVWFFKGSNGTAKLERNLTLASNPKVVFNETKDGFTTYQISANLETGLANDNLAYSIWTQYGDNTRQITSFFVVIRPKGENLDYNCTFAIRNRTISTEIYDMGPALTSCSLTKLN